MKIDWPFLLWLWGVTAVIFGGLYRTFHLHPGEERMGFGEILRRRKLATATLVALGVPLPLRGAPVAYLVPSLVLDRGHLWQGAVLLLLAASVGLFALTYALLSAIQVFLNRRAS